MLVNNQPTLAFVDSMLQFQSSCSAITPIGATVFEPRDISTALLEAHTSPLSIHADVRSFNVEETPRFDGALGTTAMQAALSVFEHTSRLFEDSQHAQ